MSTFTCIPELQRLQPNSSPEIWHLTDLRNSGSFFNRSILTVSRTHGLVFQSNSPHGVRDNGVCSALVDIAQSSDKPETVVGSLISSVLRRCSTATLGVAWTWSAQRVINRAPHIACDMTDHWRTLVTQTYMRLRQLTGACRDRLSDTVFHWAEFREFGLRWFSNVPTAASQGKEAERTMATAWTAWCRHGAFGFIRNVRGKISFRITMRTKLPRRLNNLMFIGYSSSRCCNHATIGNQRVATATITNVPREFCQMHATRYNVMCDFRCNDKKA